MNILFDIQFALRSLKRDTQAGELRVLALSVLVAVASVTAIGFFTDRVGKAMVRQASDILAADLLATSGTPIEQEIEDYAASLGLTTAKHVRFPSVVINPEDESQLVAVKAVTSAYPLRGALKLSKLDSRDVMAPLDTQAPGTVWVDAQLINILLLKQGSTLTLGARDFTVERLLLFEPDRGENVFELAPRVMINDNDLESAGLLGPGSRARYTLMMAGEPAALTDMSDWLKENQNHVRVIGVSDGSPQMQRALSRAKRFLGLASVVTVLLAGAAIALAVRQFALRQADASAVVRTLGASRANVVTWLSLRLLLICVAASLIGILVGFVAQLLLADLMKTWFSLALPAPSWRPPVIGMLTALAAVAGFGLLPVIKAGRVPVMRVLQRDYSGLQTNPWLTLLFGLVAALLVVWLQSRDILLSAIVVAGVATMLALFALFGQYLIRGVRMAAPARFKLSVAGLQRRTASSVIQLAAFAIGILALLLITLVRVDILSAWERDLPDNAPNVFVINIQPSQVGGFSQQLESQKIDISGMYPMVRARLQGSNGEAATGRRTRWEYNISHSDSLPAANTLVEGEWWDGSETGLPGLSLEHDWAEDMGYGIGDTITFKVAGVETTGIIKNTRQVDWESFQVNFFIVAEKRLLDDMPETYVTSFFLDDDFSTATASWARAFPGIATLDIGSIITRVKLLMDKASMAVEYVFFFTLFAGICVLLAAVQSTQGERIRESALLRVLGASHSQVRSAIIAEFVLLGAMAGFLAAVFATVIGWSLSRFVFELPFQFNGGLWVLGIAGGALGIGLAGYLATKKVLTTPPVVALRHT
ncbi:MAG: FtsX-like permease family protein [Granulosicoccaceae bacterium]